jgi:hypothetical protein
MKADRVQRWINRIADNQIEGFGQEREIPIRLISDSIDFTMKVGNNTVYWADSWICSGGGDNRMTANCEQVAN